MSEEEVAQDSSNSEPSLLFKLVQAQIRGQGTLKSAVDASPSDVGRRLNSFFNLRRLALEWGPVTDQVEIVSISSSNPHRFLMRRKSVVLSTMPNANDDYAGYWAQISAEIGKPGYQQHHGQNLGGRRTRFDLNVAPSGSGSKSRILVLHFDKTGPKKQETHFFADTPSPTPPQTRVGEPAELALMGYSEELGTLRHGILAGAVFGDDTDTIMVYCRAKKDPEPFALGISVTDKHDQGVSFTTDLVIDPKVKNDG